ncbi:MAG TPA: glycosyltransferase family 87 protein [Candidatus Limnocylindrales bacterium]|nr:glycosyltransferase family 87 protein [Candidatus Limnocylindrales bacterium]
MTAIPDRRRLLTVLLPVSAIAVSLGSALLALAVTPADLLGYDYAAYLEAARRLVEGQPLYDLSVTETGGFGFFYYPPPYAALMIPFLVLPASIGPWVWAAVLYAAFVGGVLAMPVRPTVRWLTLLLFGISWPLVYSLKLGQVGPLLVLTFALGWRWLDRPLHLGATIALGTIVKLQPALLLGWALATGRPGAAAVGLVIIGILSLAIVPLAGIGSWSDFLTVVLAVSRPVTTDHNFAPGAIAYQAGLAEAAATAAQWASTVVALVVAGWAWLRRSAAAGYLATVIVSQLVSPILWDHYAVVLALPVAYLLDRGGRWAVAIPLVLAWPLIGLTPPAAYSVTFWAALLGVLWIDRRMTMTPQGTVAEATT